MEDTENAAGHEDVGAGFSTFEEEASQSLIDVREHGLTSANNVQVGAWQIAQNDLDGSEGLGRPGFP